jgi:hypothetical protein
MLYAQTLESWRRVTRWRPFSMFTVAALTIALIVIDAADGFVAWSVGGLAGSCVALAVHVWLIKTPLELEDVEWLDPDSKVVVLERAVG